MEQAFSLYAGCAAGRSVAPYHIHFLPSASTPISLLLTLYLMWLIGHTLEQSWGDFRFNVYYLLGVLGAILAAVITRWGTTYYLNLSLFFAFAMLYPEMRLLLFFIIPVKIKWLACLPVPCACSAWCSAAGPNA